MPIAHPMSNRPLAQVAVTIPSKRIRTGLIVFLWTGWRGVVKRSGIGAAQAQQTNAQLTGQDFRRTNLCNPEERLMMSNSRDDQLANAKDVVLSHHRAIDSATPTQLAAALAQKTAAACRFQFTAPFPEAAGPEAAAKNFWEPIRQAFSPLQRRQDIFFAGFNHLSDEPGVWVVSMGHLLGLFDQPFLGMRPTRQSTMLRYAEFNLVMDGKIVESTLFLDALNLMAQVGAAALPASTAATP